MTTEEWKKLRERIKLREGIKSFEKEFRKHMTTFITGALAFVAGLLWQDAIQSGLNTILKKHYIPTQMEWLFKLITALLFSVIAIVSIVVISKTMKISQNN